MCWGLWLTKGWSQSSGGETTFISQSDGGTEHFAFGFSTWDYFRLTYAGSQQGWDTYDYPYYNTWYQSWTFWSVVITATSGSSSAQIFVNGNLERTFSFPAYTGTGDLFVGSGSLGDDLVLVDDIYLFTRALSASDVSDIDQAKNSFDRTGLVFLHRFHYQEPWAWDGGYGETYFVFSTSTSVFTDPADQSHNITVTGTAQLQVQYPCDTQYDATCVGGCDCAEFDPGPRWRWLSVAVISRRPVRSCEMLLRRSCLLQSTQSGKNQLSPKTVGGEVSCELC